MSNPAPTIGRVVHYRGPGTANGQFKPQTYPATIVSVGAEEHCTLFVMTEVGHMTLPNIPRADDPETPSSWSWPPRV